MPKTRLSWALAAALLALAACSTAPQVRYQSIYIDMDGTLLGPDHEPRQATLDAIRRYQACGGSVGIATGRTYEQVEAYLPRIGPDLPIVLFNGALVAQADGSIVSVTHLPEEALRPALEAGARLPGVWATLIHEERDTWVDRETDELTAMLTKGHVHPNGVIQDIASNYQGTPVKIMYFVRKEQMDETARAVTEAVGDSAIAVVTGPITLEVMARGVNKAVSIRKVLESRGIDPRNGMTFGDSGNDVEMLSTLGPGLAMGNCRQAACDAALARIGGHDTDAIADAIEKLAILPECTAE